MAKTETRSKGIAVLLAVIFGFWTWLYTYKKDSHKFWVAAGITIACFILTFITFGIWLIIWIPVAIGFYIWAIIDVCAKPDTFYNKY